MLTHTDENYISGCTQITHYHRDCVMSSKMSHVFVHPG